MSHPPKPKIMTVTSPNLQIIGTKLEDAVSTKHLSKSPSTPMPEMLNYTFQASKEPIEKHATSGGFKIPHGNFGKGGASLIPKHDTKNEKMGKNDNGHKISKKEMLEQLGFLQDEETEQILKEEPFTDSQLLETLKNKRDVADLVVENIERNITKLQLQREKLKNREKSLQNRGETRSLSTKNVENVVIYDDFDRSQYVSHNISTIEAPNLQNVEALLTAHQQRMQELKHKYLEKKIQRVDRFEGSLNNERYEEASQPRSLSNQEEPHNMRTLKVRQVPLSKKALQNVKKKENSQNFSFMPPEKRRMSPKHYEKEFRKYLENKNEENENKTGFDTKIRKKAASKGENMPKRKKIDFNLIPKDELELMQFFFEDIPQTGPDMISKDQLLEYLKKNEKILDLYDLNPLELKKELRCFLTESPNNITFNEFVAFLKSSRRRIPLNTESSADEQHTPTTGSIESGNNVCFLTDKDFDLLESIYNNLDRRQDYILSLKELLKTVRSDVQISRMLSEPLAYLKTIGKTITLDRALYQLEREGLTQEERKEKEFISWNYFKDFLKNYRWKAYLGRENDSSLEEDDTLTLDKNFLEILQSCYGKIQKIEGFCRTKELIAEIRNVKRYEFLADTIVRTKSPSSSIRTESLRDILKRIETEADEYTDFEEFLEFFSCRGRPKSLMITDSKSRARFYQEKLKTFQNRKHSSPKKTIGSPRKIPDRHELKNKTNNMMGSPRSRLTSQESPARRRLHEASGSPKLRLFSTSSEQQRHSDNVITKRKDSSNKDRSPFFERSHSYEETMKPSKKPKITDFHSNYPQKHLQTIDGYDSDPEYRPSQKIPQNLNLSYSESKNRAEKLKITVPMPFCFDEREKIRKTQALSKEKLKKKEEKKTFRANPVPEFVKERNLLAMINKEQEVRREEVKKNSRIITMQREKPFSFYTRDLEKQHARKKNRYERKEFRFKANPVPWFCSVKLFDIINEEERAKREERISKNAQISLNLAKLPPRMEKHEQEKKAHELKYGIQYGQKVYDEDCTFKPISPKKVPNFKRLQHTFQTLLDNKRRNYRPTKAQSPKFHETRKTMRRDVYEEELKPHMEPKRKRDEKKNEIQNKPVYQPPSTKKWEAALEKTKADREMKENKQKEKEKETKEREMKHMKIKERVQNSNALVDNRKALQKKKEASNNEFKEKLDNEKNRFQLWKSEMNERVKQRPLLIETATKRDKAFEKMKQLSSLHKIMMKNGIKSKDIFTEEEKELLGDLEFLKRHNMLKDIL